MAKPRQRDKGRNMIATIVAVKGTCNAGHESGDCFPLSCRYPGELCGYFFHNIFPNLSVIQHGGAYPWWTEGQTKFEYHCPDRHNQVTLLVEVLAE